MAAHSQRITRSAENLVQIEAMRMLGRGQAIVHDFLMPMLEYTRENGLNADTVRQMLQATRNVDGSSPFTTFNAQWDSFANDFLRLNPFVGKSAFVEIEVLFNADAVIAAGKACDTFAKDDFRNALVNHLTQRYIDGDSQGISEHDIDLVSELIDGEGNQVSARAFHDSLEGILRREIIGKVSKAIKSLVDNRFKGHWADLMSELENILATHNPSFDRRLLTDFEQDNSPGLLAADYVVWQEPNRVRQFIDEVVVSTFLLREKGNDRHDVYTDLIKKVAGNAVVTSENQGDLSAIVRFIEQNLVKDEIQPLLDRIELGFYELGALKQDIKAVDASNSNDCERLANRINTFFSRCKQMAKLLRDIGVQGTDFDYLPLDTSNATPQDMLQRLETLPSHIPVVARNEFLVMSQAYNELDTALRSDFTDVREYMANVDGIHEIMLGARELREYAQNQLPRSIAIIEYCDALQGIETRSTDALNAIFDRSDSAEAASLASVKDTLLDDLLSATDKVMTRSKVVRLLKKPFKAMRRMFSRDKTSPVDRVKKSFFGAKFRSYSQRRSTNHKTRVTVGGIIGFVAGAVAVIGISLLTGGLAIPLAVGVGIVTGTIGMGAGAATSDEVVNHYHKVSDGVSTVAGVEMDSVSSDNAESTAVGPQAGQEFQSVFSTADDNSLAVTALSPVATTTASGSDAVSSSGDGVRPDANADDAAKLG